MWPALLVSAIIAAPALATTSPPPQATWNMDDCAPGSPYLLNTAGEGFRGSKTGIVGCNTGRRGLAGSFRGTTWAEIEDPANLLTLGAARTVTAWVLPQSGGGIASRGEGAGAWALTADATQIRFAVRVGCGRALGCLLEVSAPAVIDRWVHVAGVYMRLDGAGQHSLQLFVDGILAASSIVPANGPAASAPGVTRVGRDLRGNVFRGLIDEVHTFDTALTAPQVQHVRSVPGETLRIAYSHNEAYFLGNPDAELERLKNTGFNTVWAYFMGPSTRATRQQFADACFAHGVAIIAPDQYLAELASHPAVIGFWTIDEPTDPIKVQRERYLAVKAVTNKRVFVVRADFADVSYRGLYAPDVQDVVVFDLYPYNAAINPRANVDVGKLLTFSRVSELFINRTSDLDKARLSRYIPVFQGFFDVGEDTWLKGDTYASSLFFNRLAGQPRSHGSFIWNYPSADSPYLMGLGQEGEDPRASALKNEYVRFATELASGAHDDLGFRFYTGHDLAAYEPQGRYTISAQDLNNGSGRFAVCADPQGSPSQFDIVLEKGDGGSFRRLYAAFSSVNALGPAIDNVQVILSYALPDGRFVEIERWPFGSAFQLRSTFVDLPSTAGRVTARIRVEWNGRSTPLAGLLGAAFALE